MQPKTDQSLAMAYLGLTLTTLFWAGNAVVARGVVDTIPPVSLAFWRWMLALVILLPLGFRGIRRQWPVIVTHWRPLLILALFSVSAFNTLLYLAAVTTTALNITLVNSTIPVAVALMAWLLLRDPVRPYQMIGIALAVAGVLIIIGRGDLATFARLEVQPGDLWMVVAVACWALYSVLLRRHSVPLEPLTFLTVQVLMGALALLPVYLVDVLLVSGGFALTTAVVPPLLYVAIFPGILAYAFWNHGVHRVGPSRSAIFMYLNPVFAAVLAGIFLGERLSLFHLSGGLLILAGLFLATRSKTTLRAPK